jgi:hypothetical protein
MSSISDSSTRSIQVAGGASQVTFTAPNKFTVRLPASGFRTGKDECALKSLTLHYSWPNVSAAMRNNQLPFKYENVNYSVVLDDGIWNFSDIQAYLEQVMMQYGLYLVNAAGVNVFFISLVANPVLYSLSLTITPVPTALPTGWTNPAGLVLTGKTPQLRILPEMVNLTGFAEGFYPLVPQTSLYQANSGIPQITNVSALNITSNICASSGLSLYPNVLASFVVPSEQRPGSLIQIQPSNLDWVGVQKATTFTEIEVAIVDQLMRPIVLRDPAGFVAIINVRRVPQ